MSRLSPQEATLSVCTQETSAALDKAKVGEAAAGDAEVHAAPTPLRFPDSTREHSHLRHRFPVTTLSTRALHGS